MMMNRVAIAVILVASLWAAQPRSLLLAADQKDDKKTDDKPAATAGTTDDEEKPAKPDRFKLPDGGVPELLTFLKDLQAYRPQTPEEIEEYRANRLKLQTAIKSAVEKIVETATEEDKKLEGYDEAYAMSLYLRVNGSRTASLDDQRKLVAELRDYLKSSEKPSPYALMSIQGLAGRLASGPHPEAAVDMCTELADILANSKDERAAKFGAKLEGMARQLTLVGKPLQLEGTLMDGSKFDWSQYRGKVVLVDFWATWCGPCRAELPNVKKNYELYHDRGFDVVGISLDENRAVLEKFLEDEANPWPTIHDGGWEANVNAKYYGVMGIPTVFLVNKEGIVVSTRARGPELGKLLAGLLGPAEPASSEKASESDAK